MLGWRALVVFVVRDEFALSSSVSLCSRRSGCLGCVRKRVIDVFLLLRLLVTRRGWMSMLQMPTDLPPMLL